MKLWTALAVSALLVGCSCSHRDDDASISNDLRNSNNHYVSAQVNGQPARINLDQVRQAFWSTQGSDMDTAMRAFEQRVNEIYEGGEIVQVDAARQPNGLLVVGFIDRNGQPGFQPGDDRLFTIEQTSPAANGQIGYSMTGWNNQPYYSGYYPYHDHSGASFMMGLMLGHVLWGHWGTSYHYYTPVEHIHVIHDYRTTYRNSPTYHIQQQQNHVFSTRFNRQNATGGLASNRKFGGVTGTTGGSTTGRRWGGGNTSTTTTTTTTTTTNSGSGWGGRRSSSSSTTSGSTGWGSRSSGSSSSSSGSSSTGWGRSSSSSGGSWGGRRSSGSFGGRRR